MEIVSLFLIKGLLLHIKESCELGDWYHDNGRCSSDSLGIVGAIGIVVDAENRKIVYMKARSQVFAPNTQDFKNLYSSLTSTTDGEGNTDKLIAAGVDKFPAVKYCNDLTAGNLKWYIPAWKEVDFSSFDFSKIGCSYPSSSTAYSSSTVAVINSIAGQAVTYAACYSCIAKY